MESILILRKEKGHYHQAPAEALLNPVLSLSISIHVDGIMT